MYVVTNSGPRDIKPVVKRLSTGQYIGYIRVRQLDRIHGSSRMVSGPVATKQAAWRLAVQAIARMRRHRDGWRGHVPSTCTAPSRAP